jgi:ribosome maturation factor RimP
MSYNQRMKRILPEPLRELIMAAAAEAGVQVYDIEYGPHQLQVFIDAPTGVTVDACSRVSEILSRRLDESSLILEQYRLEVSSPGLERKLRGIEDFRRIPGKLVHVVTEHGGLDGTVQEVSDAALVLALADEQGRPQPGRTTRVEWKEIKRARLKVSEQELFACRAPNRPKEN